MYIEILETAGIPQALEGMRNPKNSWGESTVEKDWELSRKLSNAGPEHAKHLRLIQAWFRISAPRYFWQEFDTYKIGVEKVSCSTMHKLFNERTIKLSDFEYDDEDADIIQGVVDRLNQIRGEYITTKKPSLLIRAKKILPESYIQTRTVVINYQTALNICKQRHAHRLPEWRELIAQFERLPNFKRLTSWCHYE